MTVLRATVTTCGLALLAFWLAAAAGSRLLRAPAPSADAGAAGHTAVRPAGESAAAVRDARPSSVMTGARRNIFQTRDRVPVEPLRTVLPPPQPAGGLNTPDAFVSPAPSVSLLGIAEKDEQGRRVRTAVVSAGGELWLVQEGAVVAGRFRVGAIGVDHVELTDTQGGVPRTLRLR